MIKLRLMKFPVEKEELAQAPYPPSATTITTAIRQYRVLLRMLLSSYRGGWFMHIFMGLLIPITLGFTVRATLGNINTERAIFMLGGNMAMSIAFGPTQFLITKLGWAKQTKEFEYWIALPVPKLNVILAIISVALLFALPGLVGSYVLGSLIFSLPFSGGWALVVIIPLGILPLAGIGAFIGTIAPSGQTASLIGNLLIIFVGLLSPMLIPPDALPKPLQILSLFIPTTYVADAFRIALSGRMGVSFFLDVLFLVLISAVFLALVHWKLDWRTG